ncbi:GFA family protein [Rhizobium sp. PAMB 3182]
MSESDAVHEGGCRCGALRFKVHGRPMITMACHCTGCQRMTASAFSLSSLHAGDTFEITAGEPVIGGMRGEIRHYFCPNCMSWVYTKFEPTDQFVNIRATMLDDCGDYRPFIETYTSEMLPWANTPALHSFEQFPPMDKYPELMAEYAASDY